MFVFSDYIISKWLSISDAWPALDWSEDILRREGWW
jgi:hypothetical protein